MAGTNRRSVCAELTIYSTEKLAMTATSMSRIALPYLALVAVAGAGLVVAFQQLRREPPAATQQMVSAPPKAPGDSGEAGDALKSAKAQADSLTSSLAGSPAPTKSEDGMPAFDVARIEPTGDAVIAGRAAPGATVELLRNGEPHDRVVADRSGQFAMVPRPLPPGNYELTLRSTRPDGSQMTSKQSVAVALEAKGQDKPVVALMTPNKPTEVLSQPAAATPIGGAVVVEAVETEAGGKLHVSGHSPAGAAVRLYLNDSFLAAATADADGRFAFTIKEGVAPGSYRVRLDEVEPKSGAVRSRAEVPFNAPDTVAVTSSVPGQSAATKRQPTAAAEQPQIAAATDTAPPATGSPSAVVVPKITTTTVSRGDSLWRISRLTYGEGARYAVIYKANRGQIRNPDRIYPGQVFVLPSKER